MAHKKTAPVKAAAKKNTPVTGKNDTTPEYDPNELRRVLEELHARHGRVDEAHRAAFDSLGTNARRADLGGRTKATGVLREGVSWAVQIDQAYSKYSAAVEEHYARERFVYFLDRLEALDTAIAGQGTHREGTGVKRATSEERERAAREARNKVIEKMTRIAGERAERADLEAATGTADKLGASIKSLVTLGRGWLKSSDPTLTLLCKTARLTDALLDATLAAGEALTGAVTDAALAGRKPSSDSPEVNVVEGWVLAEMMEAQRGFDGAHAESRIVPRLTPGPATRHVLSPRKTAQAQPPEGSDTPPTPS